MVRAVTAVGPFAPFVRRGDACAPDFPGEGLRQGRPIMFATAVRHSMAQERTTEVEMSEADPFREYLEHRERTLLAKRAAQRRARRARR